jgi:hypothetical protein
MIGTQKGATRTPIYGTDKTSGGLQLAWEMWLSSKPVGSGAISREILSLLNQRMTSRCPLQNPLVGMEGNPHTTGSKAGCGSGETESVYSLKLSQP